MRPLELPHPQSQESRSKIDVEGIKDNTSINYCNQGNWGQHSGSEEHLATS